MLIVRYMIVMGGKAMMVVMRGMRKYVIRKSLAMMVMMRGMIRGRGITRGRVMMVMLK